MATTTRRPLPFLTHTGAAGCRARSLAPLLACYGLAVLLPAPGQTVRSLEVAVPVSGGRVSAQTVLLALMLFDAGLSVRVAALGAVARRPGRLALAVVVNAALPAVVVPVLAVGLVRWHDPSEAEALAVGMLLMVTMPVAGGAVSWWQRGCANMPLIVAAVVGSTLLSPVTIPLGLRLTGRLLGPSGAGALDDTDTLSHLATSGAGGFALGAVVVPCLLGLAARAVIGEARARTVLPRVKRLNFAITLMVSYVNAVGAFAQFRRHPDADLAALALAAALAVCALSFLAGAWSGRLTRSTPPDAVSLTLATGMSNSSAAAVLASTWFPHLRGVLLPILCYSLVQKTVAAAVTARGARTGTTADPRKSSRPAVPA